MLSASRCTNNGSVLGLMAKAVMDTTSVASSWESPANDDDNDGDNDDNDNDDDNDDDCGLEDLHQAPPAVQETPSYDIVANNATATANANANADTTEDTKSVQSEVTWFSKASTTTSSSLPLMLFQGKFTSLTNAATVVKDEQGAITTGKTRDLEHLTANNSSNNSSSSNNNNMFDFSISNYYVLDATTAAVIYAAGWDATEIQPHCMRVVLSDMCLQYTGPTGVGARSLRARHALPICKPIVTHRTTRTPIQGRKKGLFFFRNKQVFDVHRETIVNYQPILHQAFLLSNGSWCNMPRTITYYEVDIVSGPTTGLTHQQSLSFARGEPQEEKKDEQEPPCLLQDDDDADDSNVNNDTASFHNHHPPCIAVGLTLSNFAWDCQMPGWTADSFGYHGDDGSTFCNGQKQQQQQQVEAANTFSTFGQGDVVGCGIHYAAQQVFYTLNGKWVGAVPISAAQLRQKWIPTVGVDSHAAVQYNAGTERPFVFDLRKFCLEQQQQGVSERTVL